MAAAWPVVEITGHLVRTDFPPALDLALRNPSGQMSRLVVSVSYLLIIIRPGHLEFEMMASANSPEVRSRPRLGVRRVGT